MDAWNLRDYQIAFARSVSPDDIADAQYDVVARAPGEHLPKAAEVRTMLRNLLADRFELVVHREMKEMTVYALLSETPQPRGFAAASAETPCSLHTERAEHGRNTEQSFTNCGPEELADALGHLLHDRPVVNNTGLTGTFDFKLTAIDDNLTASGPEPEDILPVTAAAKLGLKLVTRKAPVEVFVIDHIGQPTIN